MATIDQSGTGTPEDKQKYLPAIEHHLKSSTCQLQYVEAKQITTILSTFTEVDEELTILLHKLQESNPHLCKSIAEFLLDPNFLSNIAPKLQRVKALLEKNVGTIYLVFDKGQITKLHLPLCEKWRTIVLELGMLSIFDHYFMLPIEVKSRVELEDLAKLYNNKEFTPYLRQRALPVVDAINLALEHLDPSKYRIYLTLFILPLADDVRERFLEYCKRGEAFDISTMALSTLDLSSISELEMFYTRARNLVSSLLGRVYQPFVVGELDLSSPRLSLSSLSLALPDAGLLIDVTPFLRVVRITPPVAGLGRVTAPMDKDLFSLILYDAWSTDISGYVSVLWVGRGTNFEVWQAALENFAEAYVNAISKVFNLDIQKARKIYEKACKLVKKLMLEYGAATTK